MRPIDADALLKNRILLYDGTEAIDIEDVENAPTLDVTPIVHCKNCQHYFKEQCRHPDYWYTEEYPWVDPDFYCAKGESSDDL